MLSLHILSVDGKCKIFGHDAVRINDLDTCCLEILTEVAKRVVVVKFSTVNKPPGPRKDRRNRVGGRFVALLPLAVVTGNGT